MHVLNIKMLFISSICLMTSKGELMIYINQTIPIAKQADIRTQLWLRKTEAQALEEILKLCTHKFQQKQRKIK